MGEEALGSGTGWLFQRAENSTCNHIADIAEMAGLVIAKATLLTLNYC